jgi:hypothetical protein
VKYIRFEALKSVTMKVTVLWNIKPRSLVEIHRHLEKRDASIFRVKKTFCVQPSNLHIRLTTRVFFKMYASFLIILCLYVNENIEPCDGNVG